MIGGYELRKYKFSKYNLICTDDDDNMLLYNFLIGLPSLSMIPKETKENIEQLMLKKDAIFSNKLNDKLIEQLYKAGLILDEETDEDALYDALFYETTFCKSWELIIMPTQQCNFRCKYCYETSEFMSKGEISESSQISILKYIQKNARFHSKLRVSWFGGEPLLAMKAINRLSEGIIKICDNKKLIYESEITTNGYNLTPEVFDALYKNKVYIYQITLDGVKDSHDQQRIKADGTGTFEKIFENLLYIKNNKEKYKMARVTIRTNVTQKVMSYLDEFIELFNLNFGTDERFSLRFIEACKYDNNEENRRLEDSEYLQREEFLNILYDEKYREKLVSIDDVIRMFSPARYICYAASKNKYVIDPELNVYKCTVHFELAENKVGYLKNNGDMIVDETLNKMWYVRKTLPKECRDCFYLPCCNKTGCPIKYNRRDQRYNSCHMEGLKERMSINLRRLAKRIPYNIIEVEKKI